MTKAEVLHKILSVLDERITMADKAIAAAKESRDNETKSSVGDKYETGRTIMQMEVEKHRSLRSKNILLKSELEKIDLKQVQKSVSFGSLVKSSHHIYFISAALGQFEINGSKVFCISLASPIGKLLYKKEMKDSFVFQGQTHTITAIS